MRVGAGKPAEIGAFAEPDAGHEERHICLLRAGRYYGSDRDKPGRQRLLRIDMRSLPMRWRPVAPTIEETQHSHLKAIPAFTGA